MDGADTSQGEKKKRRDYTSAELASGLVHLLDVEEIDVDLYRGRRNPGGRGRVFGGQVIGQVVRWPGRACGRSVRATLGGGSTHSTHCGRQGKGRLEGEQGVAGRVGV